MDDPIKVLCLSIPLILVINVVVGQQVIGNNSSNNNSNNNTAMGFMAGSSPADPSKALKFCQSQARPRALNVSYAGTYGRHLYNWCTTYNDVMPCLDRTLPTSNDISDWFLKLILDQSRATRMSRSMCTRFPFIANLTCAEKGMEGARRCMEWSTKTSIDQYYSQFTPGQPLTEINKRMAGIYACITTVATAGCLHKQLTECSAPQRKLIYDYHIMFSGKCREIAGLEVTTADTSTETPNVTESVQVEDTKLNTALQSELDNEVKVDSHQVKVKSDKTTNSTGSQNVETGITTSVSQSVKRRNYSDMNNGLSGQFRVSWFSTLFMAMASVFML